MVHVARKGVSVDFPCSVQLVAATNPCPCGYSDDRLVSCSCSPGALARYRRRFSGPLLDRLDLRVDVPRLDPDELAGAGGEPSNAVRARVCEARERQAATGRPQPRSPAEQARCTGVVGCCPAAPGGIGPPHGGDRQGLGSGAEVGEHHRRPRGLGGRSSESHMAEALAVPGRRVSDDARLRLAMAGLHPDRVRDLVERSGRRPRCCGRSIGAGSRSADGRSQRCITPQPRCGRCWPRLGVRPVWRGGVGYPADLGWLPDAPDLLFVRGEHAGRSGGGRGGHQPLHLLRAVPGPGLRDRRSPRRGGSR